MRSTIFVDVETTSADVASARIVQIAWVRREPGGQVQEFSSLVNPGIPIPPESTLVHGISDADVDGAPFWGELAPRFLAALEGCDVAGHNAAAFDVPVLVAALGRAQLDAGPLKRARILDTMLVARKLLRLDLSSLVRLFLGREQAERFKAHGALADVLAARDVLDAVLELYPELPREAGALVAWQHEKPADWVDPDGKLRRREDGQVVMAFGKHTGRTLAEMAEREAGYLRWMLEPGRFSEGVQAAIRAAL